MPTYDFHCGYCIVTTEVFCTFDKQVKIPSCPKCGAAMSRVFSNPGVVFKGSGFYKTDNK